VPVFDITAGDKQKLTKFLSRTHRSSIWASISALLYGAMKAVGFYFATLALRALG
jgi:hypothetical protein